jgi:nucleoside-diphosphate-sugar epimerase
MQPRRILITGAAGKVGTHFIQRCLADPRFDNIIVRALCHSRTITPHSRLEVARGSIAERGVVKAAMRDVTHVLHLATCKETPETIMDVAVKGLFWILEECRMKQSFQQFLLIGGDAGMGHFFYPHPIPVTETQKHSAYPGCYALSKVLEEVMMEQYAIQYGLNVCCLRAPWIMEKDDFKYQLSFGDDVFGGPRWRDFVTPEIADRYVQSNTIPVMRDPDGLPVQRNFVHVDDLTDAILAAIDHSKARGQTFNVCMDEPVNYQAVAEHLHKTRGYSSVDIITPFHSTWLDNAKAKFLLGWRPQYDLARMIDAAYDYCRAKDDARQVWYPG